MTFDKLPLIRCRPTPSGAELEADRDRQHARDCADYSRRMAYVVDWAALRHHLAQALPHSSQPVGEVQG